MGFTHLESGAGNLPGILNSLDSYILVTMDEALALVRNDISTPPAEIILNRDMSVEALEALEARAANARWVVGLGGGTSCDTAKYLAWKRKKPLLIAPSIISVDAWLCRSIAVRQEGKVRYIGDVAADRLVVDYGLIKQAPAMLNRAGVADIISIATALGDWIIARDLFGDRFDEVVFQRALAIVEDLMGQAENIRAVNDVGIAAMVKGQAAEVELCEEYGSARPEEGGEHFLAYCLEEITRGHYVHGNLIALNVLVTLKLQRERAVFDYHRMKGFFDACGLAYAPGSQGIRREDYRLALETVSDYVYREKLFPGLWSQGRVFDDTGERSLDGILDWVYSF